jgi:uncharacterized protein
MTDLTTPLREDELDQLCEFLDSLESPRAMNIERLDGFLCALVAGPETVMLSEYWPKVVGADASDAPTFDTIDQARDVMNLLTRHWNTIASTLRAGEVYLPILLLDEANISRGNNWAKGFVDGVEMRPASWRKFIDDEEHGAAIVPMFALAHENDPDPERRFDSPTPEKREELLHLMTAYLVKIYQYFANDRSMKPLPGAQPFSRSTPKIGRNDPCSCGSGKKFKHCCLTQMH